MRVLVAGAGGQVGQAVIRRAPGTAIVLGVTREQCDIADAAAVGECIRAFSPDVVVNAAAYTAVDQAESEPALAERVNAQGVRVLAEAARATGARLLHVSTDFVFDGRASTPYLTDALPAPLNIYGKTKWQGEIAAQNVPGLRLAILRTAWVYAPAGRNFLTTMLRIMRDHGRVRVVTDQVGTPTAADSVADALWSLAARPDLTGTYHWTDAGIASWYDFADAIADEAAAVGLLSSDVAVEPIATHQFPTAARRPAYSVLDKESSASVLGLTGVHWRRRLREIIRGMSDE